MVQDPYKVLGISQGATQEEIKKAYRRKTKEYHPDIHPNDPGAEAKMAEINGAYDMLMNPEKYAKYQQQTSGQSGYSQGGYRQNGYHQSDTGNSQYGSYQGRGSEYRGAGGWTSDFSGFDFGDIFGFGFGGEEQISNPQIQPGDSNEFCQAINAINQSRYQQATGILNTVISSGRNARWYYLSAFANNAAGNTSLALEQIQKAVQLDPNNRDYQLLLQKFHQTSRSYQQGGQGFNMAPVYMQKYCLGFCLANMMCHFCY